MWLVDVCVVGELVEDIPLECSLFIHLSRVGACFGICVTPPIELYI